MPCSATYALGDAFSESLEATRWIDRRCLCLVAGLRCLRKNPPLWKRTKRKRVEIPFHQFSIIKEDRGTNPFPCDLCGTFSKCNQNFYAGSKSAAFSAPWSSLSVWHESVLYEAIKRNPSNTPKQGHFALQGIAFSLKATPSVYKRFRCSLLKEVLRRPIMLWTTRVPCQPVARSVSVVFLFGSPFLNKWKRIGAATEGEEKVEEFQPCFLGTAQTANRPSSNASRRCVQKYNRWLCSSCRGRFRRYSETALIPNAKLCLRGFRFCRAKFIRILLRIRSKSAQKSYESWKRLQPTSPTICKGEADRDPRHSALSKDITVNCRAAWQLLHNRITHHPWALLVKTPTEDSWNKLLSKLFCSQCLQSKAVDDLLTSKRKQQLHVMRIQRCMRAFLFRRCCRELAAGQRRNRDLLDEAGRTGSLRNRTPAKMFDVIRSCPSLVTDLFLMAHDWLRVNGKGSDSACCERCRIILSQLPLRLASAMRELTSRKDRKLRDELRNTKKEVDPTSAAAAVQSSPSLSLRRGTVTAMEVEKNTKAVVHVLESYTKALCSKCRGFKMQRQGGGGNSSSSSSSMLFDSTPFGAEKIADIVLFFVALNKATVWIQSRTVWRQNFAKIRREREARATLATNSDADALFSASMTCGPRTGGGGGGVGFSAPIMGTANHKTSFGGRNRRGRPKPDQRRKSTFTTNASSVSFFFDDDNGDDAGNDEDGLDDSFSLDPSPTQGLPRHRGGGDGFARSNLLSFSGIGSSNSGSAGGGGGNLINNLPFGCSKCEPIVTQMQQRILSFPKNLAAPNSKLNFPHPLGSQEEITHWSESFGKVLCAETCRPQRLKWIQATLRYRRLASYVSQRWRWLAQHAFMARIPTRERGGFCERCSPIVRALAERVAFVRSTTTTATTGRRREEDGGGALAAATDVLTVDALAGYVRLMCGKCQVLVASNQA